MTTLYPDFAQLRKEGIEFKDVVSDETGKVAYTKYYITPTMYSAGTCREIMANAFKPVLITLLLIFL